MRMADPYALPVSRSTVRGESGLTLIELSIALIILGLITAAGINLYNQAETQRQTRLTYEHMDEIVNALSIYAETSGRIPCPGDPAVNNITFGWERGVALVDLNVGSGRFPVGACNSANNEGIVPFLSLNLTDDIARDGWGRYFTYAVSPQFSRTNDQSHLPSNVINNAADIGTVHGRCRTEGWAARFDSHNISAVKARFCCADQSSAAVNNNQTIFSDGTDLIITHTAAGEVLSPARSATGIASPRVGIPVPNIGDSYAFLTTTTLSTATGNTLPVAISSTQSPILTPAFVLVSHGKNGAGAYLGNNGAGRYNVAGESAKEAINADGSPGAAALLRQTFIDGPINTAPGAAYFDDIVRWMTQDSLIAAHGAISCQYP